jgi:hypothetical protein
VNRRSTGEHAAAFALCALAAFLLLWPLLTGQILFGGARSDMYIAGYSFRLFAADWFKETGSIPQWNPYLYGGLPYIGAMHGDIFYPTAWLRWIMPVDLAITWGMALHFVLAGWFTYRFCRSLGLSWGAGVVAGIAYQLTGIVASQMSPGHDGKLFVSALTPLGFWVLLAAIRHRRLWAYGAFAFVVALSILGHYHMAYFLLIAFGLWALYLAFWDPERPRDLNPWRAIGFAALAVVIGVGITALQVLPFIHYIPFSPRAEGAPDQGWAFASTYAMPPSEIFTLLLPEFNGVLDHYWGRNPIKFHTEYIGFLPLALAALALGDRARRRLVIALCVGAFLFLIFSFGSNTPLYRPFFEILPLVKKIRAMGMVFYLVAFPICVLAAIGFERVITKTVPKRTVIAVVGAAAVFALLGVVGGLQELAEGLAIPERYDAVRANAPYLRVGAARLMFFVMVGGAVLWLTVAGRLPQRFATVALIAILAADTWSIDREFYTFSPRAKTLFADDAVTTYLKKIAPPYRVLDAGSYGQYSILMAYRIPVVLGYHGFSLQRYNELAGKDDGFRNVFSPNLIDLLGVRFLILGQPQEIPGFHQVVAPTTTVMQTPAVLYERDSTPPWARVLPSSAKLAEAQVVPTVVDPRFPASRVALFPDTSSVASPQAAPPFAPSHVTATVQHWKPGEMTIALQGSDAAPGHLLVSENWYPDWHAEVDGKPGVVRRADHSLLSVDLPAGARSVRLWFDSADYARGKIISAVALLLAVGMIGVGARGDSQPSTL